MQTLMIASKQRYFVDAFDAAANLEGARDEILALPDSAFDRYESTFEAKWTLRDKHNLPQDLNELVIDMEFQVRRLASGLFNVELALDSPRHYCGVFKYDAGDHLGVHVDAGLHPIVSNKRKHVTALVYLSDGKGALEFWDGDDCTRDDEEPAVYQPVAAIEPKFGQMVLFENNDYAWHGAAVAEDTRLVVTVSYLSGVLDSPPFTNTRQRAYFVPRPHEEWDAETYARRDTRADSMAYATAYR